MPHSTTSEAIATIKGQQVDVASLRVIDYGRLVAKEPKEIENLLDASQMPGFFHLDLNNAAGQDILTGLEEIYKVSEKHHGGPPEDKMKDLEIRRDAILQGTLALPDPIKAHKEQIEQFSSLCHSAALTMLSGLSNALKLEGLSRFETKRGDDKVSDTALNMIYAPAKGRRADQPDTTHTDTGIITLLFCNQWANMIEDPKTKSWSFIEPKPGCVLVNVADALQKISGDKLHSCRHAISQPADGFEKRHFVVYYLRPGKAT